MYVASGWSPLDTLRLQQQASSSPVTKAKAWWGSQSTVVKVGIGAGVALGVWWFLKRRKRGRR